MCIRDREKLLRGVKSSLLAFLPKAAARKVGQVATLTNKVFFNFIRGQLLECVILGSLCYVGMSILRLDYALLISSVVALGALIPILGAYIGAAVGVIILLLVHPLDAVIFLVFLLILQQVEGNLIYPRVVGSSIGLPPLWTLFAVVFWGCLLYTSRTCVRKLQDLWTRKNPPPPGREFPHKSTCSCSVAVSYTHLDVYKRQYLHRPACGHLQHPPQAAAALRPHGNGAVPQPDRRRLRGAVFTH